MDRGLNLGNTLSAPIGEEIFKFFAILCFISSIKNFLIFIYVLQSINQLTKMECIIVDPLKSNKILNPNDNLALLSIQ